MPRQLKLPGNYAGGKRRAAPIIWQLLGDPDYYVEPFCGWASVFYGRPPSPERGKRRMETIGDADGIITNLHRAVRFDPAGVVAAAAWPPNDLDQRARIQWLTRQRPTLVEMLLADPDAYDVRAAGWALWSAMVSISPKWATGITAGVYRTQTRYTESAAITAAVYACAERLRDVTVYSGDWEVAVNIRALVGSPDRGRTYGVYLDPPYESHTKAYAHGGDAISERVRGWCVNRMAPYVRAVLSGYDDEHDELLDHGWTKHQGLAKNGTGRNGTEQLWASPACLDPDSPLPDALHMETP